MRSFLLAITLLFGASASAADETRIPFFPTGAATCLGSGLRTALAPDAEAQDVTLVRQAESDPISEGAAWNRLRAAKGLPAEIWFQPVWAAVRLRRETRPRIAQLGCLAGDGGTLSCTVDCDGGGVRVRDDAEGYALRSNGLRLGGLCGSSQERVWWKAGPHDTDVALRRLDAPACKAAIESMRPAHATTGRPVMDRIAEGRTCFARRYDAAHLKSRAAQRVKEIRVAWKGFDPADGNRGSVVLDLRLRTGETASQVLICQPEGFAVQCFPQKGDGDLLLTRAEDRRIRLSTKGLESELTRVGGLSLGKGDDVFLLDEAPCEAPPKRAAL